MLDVQHLEVRYGPTEVLRDVSFTVPANTVIALLGGNGSGKTTVLNAVSGLVAPRAGTVRVAGEAATGASPHVHPYMAYRPIQISLVEVKLKGEPTRPLTALSTVVFPEPLPAARSEPGKIRAAIPNRL
jgi:ABC-type multidrug transport system ATPase subunit